MCLICIFFGWSEKGGRQGLTGGKVRLKTTAPLPPLAKVCNRKVASILFLLLRPTTYSQIRFDCKYEDFPAPYLISPSASLGSYPSTPAAAATGLSSEEASGLFPPLAKKNRIMFEASEFIYARRKLNVCYVGLGLQANENAPCVAFSFTDRGKIDIGGPCRVGWGLELSIYFCSCDL